MKKARKTEELIPAGLWVRVSTEDQTVANQLDPLRQLARARGWAPVVYEDSGSAWTYRPRPELMRLLDDARTGKIRVVAVAALDRLGRNMAGMVETVRQLTAYGCQVVSLREPWLDTASPVRDLLLAIFGWVAEQESRVLSERTKVGMARAASGGTRSGRPIGRARVEDTSPELAERLARAAARVPEVGQRAAAREEGFPASTLRDYMRRTAVQRGARKGGAETVAPAQREGRADESVRKKGPLPRTGPSGRAVHLPPGATPCRLARKLSARTTAVAAEVTCPYCTPHVDAAGPLLRAGARPVVRLQKCECTHIRGSHEGPTQAEAEGKCLRPGCGCRGFRERGADVGGPLSRADGAGTCDAVHESGARCTHPPKHNSGWHSGVVGGRVKRWKNEGYVYQAPRRRVVPSRPAVELMPAATK